MTFRNPILPGFNPDPSIIRVDDDYFLATSSFEYFPGIPIYTSKDLVDWKRIGHVLSRPSQLDLRTCAPSGGIYAPTLRRHQGRFYVTVTAIHRRGGSDTVPPRGFHVWTDDIWDQSSWSDPIYHDVLGIDQDLFWDQDGTVYLSYAVTEFQPHFRLYVNTCIIDIATGRRRSPVKVIATWEHDNKVAEGPHIFTRGGYYYLITANGGTEVNHQEWVYRSREGPFGPWVAGEEGTINPMVSNGVHPEVQQTGHMDLVEGKNGEWWAVFLGVRSVEREGGTDLSQLGRETFLATVEWVDDWPIVNQRRPISVISTGIDSLLPRTFHERFDFVPGMDMGLAGWYNLRTPLKVEHDLESRPGSLGLLGGPYDIRTDECITAFFQKQTAFEGEYRTCVDYPDPEEGHEAGVAIWWSKAAHASLGIRETAEGRELVLRTEPNKPILLPLGKGELHIRIQVTSLRYTFFATLGSAPEIEIGVYDSQHLVRPTEPSSLFTGTHFGLFAMGANGMGSMSPAYFADVSWSGVRGE